MFFSVQLRRHADGSVKFWDVSSGEMVFVDFLCFLCRILFSTMH